MKVPTELHINTFKHWDDHFKANIKEAKNILGFSSLGYEKPVREIVIKHQFGIKTPPKMRLTSGQIGHQINECEPIRTKIVMDINRDAEILGEPISSSEQSMIVDFEEVEDSEGKLVMTQLRYTADIRTPHYIVEQKFTAAGIKAKKDGELVWTQYGPDWLTQLNGYMCYFEVMFGVIMVINLNVFTSSTKDWERLLNDHSYNLVFEPDYHVYEDSKKRASELFKLIYHGKPHDIACPVHAWSCKFCAPEVKEKCGSPIIYDNIKLSDECSVCGETQHAKGYGDRVHKTTGQPVFYRHGKMYCKSEKCEKACLDAWRAEK